MVIFESPPYRVFARRSSAGCLRSCRHRRHTFWSFMCVVWDEPWCAGERYLFPQPKSAAKGIGVIACATTRRQRFELLGELRYACNISAGRRCRASAAASSLLTKGLQDFGSVGVRQRVTPSTLSFETTVSSRKNGAAETRFMPVSELCCDRLPAACPENPPLHSTN
jgi:hypothetical protein